MALLPFRGQYLFGPMPNRKPVDFAERRLPDGRVLLHHPSLPVSVQSSGHTSGLLVGSCFDPANPQANLDDILRDLLEGDVDRTVYRTARLAGRWVLIVLSPLREVAVADACGTMPAHWTSRDDNTWVAASSRLLGHCIDGLPPNSILDASAFNELQTNPLHYSGQPYPVGMTEYDSVRVLLPNHVLDLKSHSETRFHPLKVYPQLKAKDVAPQVADLLVRIFESMAAHAPLTMAVTSGFDSRALVGAISRVPGLAAKTKFFTFQDPFETFPGHVDILNGRKISEAVEGAHEEIVVHPANEEVRRVVRNSDAIIAPRFENWAGRSLDAPFQDRLTVIGWCSEVGRNYIRWEGSDDVMPHQIRDCMGLRKVPEVQSAFDRWFSEAFQARSNSGVNILDLYYWELRAGRWVSSNLNVLNAASDWVSPYSCRELLDLLLSVKEEQRGGKAQVLYREIIKQLQPKLLDIPINPMPIELRSMLFFSRKAAVGLFRRVLVRTAKMFGLYGVLQKLRLKIRS
jgi:hypothetical protein